MNPIQVNCPECQKLYLVRPDDLSAGDLTFQCQDCHSYFGFSWPQPPGISSIKAKKIENKEVPQTDIPQTDIPQSNASGDPDQGKTMRTCFKCEAKVDTNLPECPKCGVIFDKAKKATAPNLVMEFSNPEVAAAWEAVKTNYGDEKRHESFIQLCLSRDNLPFASTQYRNILTANPAEEIAKRMQNRIVDLATTTYIAAQTTARQQPVPRFKKLGTFAVLIGIIFIVIGLSSVSLRPMIAIGLAIFAFLFVLRTLNRA